MKTKNLIYIGVVLIVLVGSLFAGLGMRSRNEEISGNVVNINLDKYRSEDIPEECRLGDYDDNIESWKQHLSHHQETLYCLDYYKEE